MLRVRVMVWTFGCLVLAAGCGPAVADENAGAGMLAGGALGGAPPVVVSGPPQVYAPPPPAYRQAPPVYVPVTAAPAPGTCQDYRTRIVVDGQAELAWGTACLQPNGTWQPAP
jgi:hypothetical protein